MAFNNAVDASSAGVQTLSSAGVWSGSALTQYSTLTGGASNAIVSLGVATNGQVVIGSTGTTPVLSTITAGTGITVTNAAGSITISASTSGFSWSEPGAGSFASSAEKGYSATGAATTTLPSAASSSLGDTIVFQANTLGTFVITANAGTFIRIGSSLSSSGGSITSTTAGAGLTLIYATTNTVWIAHGVQGNWTVA